jgi:hypothetical protein
VDTDTGCERADGRRGKGGHYGDMRLLADAREDKVGDEFAALVGD